MVRLRNKNAPWQTPERIAPVAALVVGVLLGLLPLTTAGERLELRTHDLRFFLRGERPFRTRIVIAAITDATYKRWSDAPLALWNSRIARAIHAARANGASQIALDVIPVLNADDFLDTLGATPEKMPDYALQQEIEASGGRVAMSYVQEPPLFPNARFRSLDILAGRFGFADLPNSPDDVVRQVWRHHPRDPNTVGLAELLARGIPNGPTAPRENAVYLDLPGRHPEAAFYRIDLDRLANGELTAADRGALQNAIVLVGATDRASTDRLRLPGFGSPVFGVLVQADALATLAENRILHRWPIGWGGWLAGFLGLAVTLLVFRIGAIPGAAISLLGLLAYDLLALLAFIGPARLILPVAAPSLAFILPWFGRQLFRAWEEARERRRMERVFGRYLSPEIGRYLLENPSHQNLGGASVEATVLFFDIRGSTQYAERTSPHEVVAGLNTLFSALLPVIEAHGGLVNRFLGDGFLALFGVPLPRDDHAYAAVAASLEILRATEEVNRDRVSRGKPPWRVGCGLHTGDVLAGSIGGQDRAEFTVIGDTVNLAARLEAMNKTLESVIVISARTWEQATAQKATVFPAIRPPREMPVSGREQGVTVYWYALSDLPHTGASREHNSPAAEL